MSKIVKYTWMRVGTTEMLIQDRGIMQNCANILTVLSDKKKDNKTKKAEKSNGNFSKGDGKQDPSRGRKP